MNAESDRPDPQGDAGAAPGRGMILGSDEHHGARDDAEHPYTDSQRSSEVTGGGRRAPVKVESDGSHLGAERDGDDPGPGIRHWALVAVFGLDSRGLFNAEAVVLEPANQFGNVRKIPNSSIVPRARDSKHQFGVSLAFDQMRHGAPYAPGVDEVRHA